MATGTYKYQSDFARHYFAQGFAEGLAEVVLKVLEMREVVISAAERERVLTCVDTDRLNVRLERAPVVGTADEFFA
ncbi:hypothetical protein [Actinomadura parmotrematis]|uniref:Uncharacterized protein n=1 Tax=Actinomadura parmotrematis TaxID=2864039 RepID=A0ABS7FVD4_9ACTN|nr:hypothetical protein [Actinomadura parmotrematis]MBW8484368.1 hypothetical protein [Actinomadura parmotrematis]